MTNTLMQTLIPLLTHSSAHSINPLTDLLEINIVGYQETTQIHDSI